MKQIFSILSILFFFNLVSAQTTSNSNEFTFAIFPGCEKMKEREDQFTCLQKGLTSNYTRHLQKYIDSFEYLNIGEAAANVKFTIQTDGRLELKQVEASNSIYKEYTVLAFIDMVNELNEKKLKLIPSKSTKDGSPVAVTSSFPVNFKLHDEFEETENRVISILNDGNTIYEVILTPKNDIKIYEVGGIKPFYLGKYNSIQEIKNTLPYKNLIQEKDELVTLAQSDFQDVKIILQSKNIFHQAEFNTFFIVSEVKRKRIKQLRKYTSLKDFVNSPYYKWIVRD
ncbi:MAG: hypothetical protein KIG88_08780 [Weeksellaceae bacterium]|nr:hypothetical protein [Weeksellaceae bacterium]